MKAVYLRKKQQALLICSVCLQSYKTIQVIRNSNKRASWYWRAPTFLFYWSERGGLNAPEAHKFHAAFAFENKRFILTRNAKLPGWPSTSSTPYSRCNSDSRRHEKHRKVFPESWLGISPRPLRGALRRDEDSHLTSISYNSIYRLFGQETSL